jgi:hypothetical protein
MQYVFVAKENEEEVLFAGIRREGNHDRKIINKSEGWIEGSHIC